MPFASHAPSPQPFPEGRGRLGADFFGGVLLCDVEGFMQLGWVFATSLRHLWTPAATAAGDLCRFADPIAGLQAFGDEIITDGGDEADLCAIAGRHHRGEAWRALLDRIDHRAKLFVVRAVDRRDDDLPAASGLRLFQKVS